MIPGTLGSIPTTISPVAPGGQESPFSSMMSTLNWGDGFPMDPGLGVMPLRVPMVIVVSVWP